MAEDSITALEAARAAAYKKHVELNQLRFVKAYIDAARVFLDAKEGRREKYRSEYALFYGKYFCSRAEDYHNFINQLDGNNLFGEKVDVKKFLEEYYDIEL